MDILISFYRKPKTVLEQTLPAICNPLISWMVFERYGVYQFM